MGPHLSVTKSLVAKCPSWPLGFAKAARSATYRQLSLAPDQRRLAIVTVRDPQPGNRGASPPNTYLFGSVAAALQYVSLSSNFRILNMPAAGYIDGFGIIVSRPLSERALMAASALKEIFGFELE